MDILRAKDRIISAIIILVRLVKIVSLYVIVPIAGVVVFLYLAEFLHPDQVHVINKDLTTGIVDELVSDGKHHAAIYIMENNSGFLAEADNRREFLENICHLTDCYMHVGDFDKAQQILQLAYDNPFLGVFELEETNESFARYYFYCISSRLAQIYSTTGEKQRASFYWERMRENMDYTMAHLDKLEKYYDGDFDTDDFKISAWSKRIDILAENDARSALVMINRILKSEKTSSVFRLHLHNKSAEIYLSEGDTISIGPSVYAAVVLAQSIPFMAAGDYSELGRLSDYCYLLHDDVHGEFFLREYLKYLGDHYGKNDLAYLVNSIRGFRLLEEQRAWGKLESAIENCCTGIRKNIETNFRSMSEGEREYFAKLLNEPFDYAIQYLYKHPDSRRIAKLCFDNTMFQQGLYLRSNAAVKNAVESLGDKDLTEKYERLVECKSELDARRSAYGFGNSFEIRKLESEVSQLDKFVSERCWAYQYHNFEKQKTHADLLPVMDENEAVIEFAETPHGELYCLILKKSGDVTFVPIAHQSEFAPFTQLAPNDVYRNTEFTEMVFGSIRRQIAGVKRIYYSTSGSLNSICIPALCDGGTRYLCDSYYFKLVSNCQKIIELKSADKTRNTPQVRDTKFCLWGGITYTANDTVSASPDNMYRAITLQHPLAFLGAAEIDEIANTLKKSSATSVKMWKYSHATEQSFRNHSGPGIDFLHISTHGYFDNSSDSKTAMHNSVLFFAGANRFWTNDSMPAVAAGNDGILRADEISHLNLNGCKLVVLSACETGLGYNGSTEGVYGLQRAFKLAGADKLLMSLWNVKNMRAEEMMDLFYKQLCSNGFDIEDAFLYSRGEMKKRYPNSPEYWAAFVLLD